MDAGLSGCLASVLLPQSWWQSLYNNYGEWEDYRPVPLSLAPVARLFPPCAKQTGGLSPSSAAQAQPQQEAGGP